MLCVRNLWSLRKRILAEFSSVAKQGGARIAVINCRIPTAPARLQAFPLLVARLLEQTLANAIFFCRKPTRPPPAD